MWDLPRPGLEPLSPARAGGFLTTAPPGKPLHLSLMQFGNQIQLVDSRKPKDPERPHKKCGEPKPFCNKESKSWDSGSDSLTCYGLNQRLGQWNLIVKKWTSFSLFFITPLYLFCIFLSSNTPLSPELFWCAPLLKKHWLDFTFYRNITHR